MINGCYTALITPFQADGVDYNGLARLVTYQIENGISGILAVGTTGESPTLNWAEHIRVIEQVAKASKGRIQCIAGTGSNNTAEALTGTRHAVEVGVDAVLLVDPYYNGPSSQEIRKEYVAPIAKAVPGTQVIPYIIPGRSGTQLLPEDLALLAREFDNVQTVKDATGNLENMRRTRACCGPAFSILSGDDGLTYEMMTDAAISAAGVISVFSNLFPRAVSDMVRYLQGGEVEKARALNIALDPLFQLVSVKTMETTPWGHVVCKAKNPLAIKTLMAILGLPAGFCRPPLGKLSQNGLETVLAAARKVLATAPELFEPVAAFFKVNVEERLDTPKFREGLYYETY
ncbi:MAG: 4-hydroxy-tetrahydrodipicolinate synthase [Desulfobacterales bacterium]|nr:4-hydroxy-tetrahydrodipicolinate synthase [Desulfobacterales bacterium]